MRTTVTISDNIFKELLSLTHSHSRNEAINIAIKDWIRLQKLQQLQKLRGHLEIADNIKELRQLEIKEISDDE